jgi:hypothetical protein
VHRAASAAASARKEVESAAKAAQGNADGIAQLSNQVG